FLADPCVRPGARSYHKTARRLTRGANGDRPKIVRDITVQRLVWQAPDRPVTYPAMEFRELARINGGYAEARILQAAVTLGLFDRLDAAGRPAAVIATGAGTDARATELLLNALVAMRLVRKDGDLFKETEVSRTYLTTASPTSYGGFVRFDAALWPLWGELAE